MRGLALLLLATGAVAGPDERAKKHYEKYLELRTRDDYTLARRYNLRELGKYDCDTARKGLLRIFKTTRDPDERVVCIHSLARVADVATIRLVYARLERKADAALAVAWSQAMGRCAGEEVRLWLATDALRTAVPRILAATAEALVVLRRPEAADALVALYRRHERTPEVAAACVRALGALDDERLVPAALAHADWRVRQALADYPPPEVWKKLARDPAAHVRRALATALGRANDTDAVPVLAGMLEQEPRLRTRHAAKVALQKITDRDLGWDPSAWRDWLKEQEGRDRPARRTFARYYGFSVHSDRVLFLVDVSGSMVRPWDVPTNRIQVAGKQLARVLGELARGTLFNVLVFSNRVRAWSKAEVPADEKSVRKAIAWARREMTDPDGDTATLPALERAFAKNPEFDTLFLLSDGNPTHGVYNSPEGVLASVRAMNRFRRATVHTIALTLEHLYLGRPMSGERTHLMKGLMRQLAAQNEGRYELVSRPPR